MEKRMELPSSGGFYRDYSKDPIPSFLANRGIHGYIGMCTDIDLHIYVYIWVKDLGFQAGPRDLAF